MLAKAALFTVIVKVDYLSMILLTKLNQILFNVHHVVKVPWVVLRHLEPFIQKTAVCFDQKLGWWSCWDKWQQKRWTMHIHFLQKLSQNIIYRLELQSWGPAHTAAWLSPGLRLAVNHDVTPPFVALKENCTSWKMWQFIQNPSVRQEHRCLSLLCAFSRS